MLVSGRVNTRSHNYGKDTAKIPTPHVHLPDTQYLEWCYLVVVFANSGVKLYSIIFPRKQIIITFPETNSSPLRISMVGPDEFPFGAFGCFQGRTS